jgi:HSP20 family protein
MAKKNEKKVKINKSKKPKQEKTTSPAVWDPFEFMDVMDRSFWDDPWIPMWQRRRWGSMIPRQPWLSPHWEPNMKITASDLLDTGRQYKVVAEMPGIAKKDIEVSVTPNDVRICGEINTEKKQQDENYVKYERRYSTLCRTMQFPEEVDPNKAEASLRDGILEIRVDKKTPIGGKGKTIPVK